MASIMASETHLLRNPNPSLFSPNMRAYCSKPVIPSFLPFSPKPLSLNCRKPKPYNIRPLPKLRVSASSASPVMLTEPQTDYTKNSSTNLFSDSTRTVSTIFAIAFGVSKLLLNAIRGVSVKIKGICMNPTPEELAAIQKIQGNLVCTVGPLFFAALRDRPSGYLNTPLTVVASGMAKWLDIYSGVLMVRVLLSWFPNIPWDRQPLSAIRDLCDPYLNLFRNIIPPIFDTLDVSPLLAFAVLGTLGSILNNSRGQY